MKTYSVFNGEYPFDIFLGVVSGDTPEAALEMAIRLSNDNYPHPVIEEATQFITH